MSTRKIERSLRHLPQVDYYIPGDDVHHRHPSPSPHREPSSSARRSTSRSRDQPPTSALRQPAFDDAIEEEPAEERNGEDEAEQEEEEPGQDDGAEEAEESAGVEEDADAGGGVEGKGRSRRQSKRGGSKAGKKRESAKAALQRKAIDLAGKAKALLSTDKAEHKEGEEQTGEATEGEEAGENSQPEGTPAKPRRRASRRVSHAKAEGETLTATQSGAKVSTPATSSSRSVLLGLAATALLLLLASFWILPALMEGAGVSNFMSGGGGVPSDAAPHDAVLQRQYAADKEALLKSLRAESAGKIRESAEALTTRIERSAKESNANVAKLEAEVKAELNRRVSSLSEEVGRSITGKVGEAVGKEKKEREAETEKVRLQLLHDVSKQIDQAVDASTSSLMKTIQARLDGQAAKVGQVEADGAELSLRVTAQLTEMEERVLHELLGSAEKAFSTRDQLARVDKELRESIARTISEADHVGQADLHAVEARVMSAVDRKVSELKAEMDGRGLSEEVRATITDDILGTLRGEMAALRKTPHGDTSASMQELVQDAVARAMSKSTVSQDRDELRHYIDAHLERLLTEVQGGGRTDEVALHKIAALESVVRSLEESVRSGGAHTGSSAAVSPAQVRSAVMDVLSRQDSALYQSLAPSVQADISAALELYSADRTNLVDYALQSSGGRILAASPTHYALPFNPTTSPFLSLFSRPWLPSKRPEEMLQPTTSVGSCWPMEGQHGSVLIGLRERIVITGVTLQHVSAGLLSGGAGAMPRNIRVRGVSDADVERVTNVVVRGDVDGDGGEVLGEWEYSSEGTQVQQWPVQRSRGHGKDGEGYQYVRLDVLSNHNNPNYTCIYRLRVHGDPVG